ncbi:hypothetical protein EJ576_22520 [Pseudomonas sp. C 49-2]|nr:hypothetical protein EJ576_22520 [Pseudomonas sp. C 49-2]
MVSVSTSGTDTPLSRASPLPHFFNPSPADAPAPGAGCLLYSEELGTLTQRATQSSQSIGKCYVELGKIRNTAGLAGGTAVNPEHVYGFQGRQQTRGRSFLPIRQCATSIHRALGYDF